MATEAFIIAVSTQGTREVNRDLSSIGTTGVEASKQVDSISPAVTRAVKSLSGLGTGFKVAMDAARLSQAQVRAFGGALDSVLRSLSAASFGNFGVSLREAAIAAALASTEMRNLGIAVEDIVRGVSIAGMRNLGIALKEAATAAALAQTEMRNLGLAMEGIGRGAAIAGMRNLGTALREATSAAALAQTQMRNLGLALDGIGRGASIAGMRNLGTALKDYGAAARAAAVESDAAGSAMNRMQSRVDALHGSLKFMRDLLVTFSFFRAVTAVSEGVSEVQQTSNMLSQVTKDVETQSRAFDMLGDSATKVHAPLEAFTQMVVAIERSSASFGKTTGDVVKATQTMFATFALSGLDSSAVSNVSKDMREVFNLGIVQGRQFRAIITQDQTEALLLSKYIQATGVNAAAANKKLEEMRKAGEQPSIYELSQKFKGAFTGSDVFNANVAGNAEAMSGLGRTTVTVGQAFTDLHTRFAEFLNDANTATGVTSAMSQGIEFLASNMRLTVLLVGLLGAALLTRFVLGPIIASMVSLGIATITTAYDLGVGMVTAIGSAVTGLISLGAVSAATLGEVIVTSAAEALASMAAFGAEVIASLGAILIVALPLAGLMLAVGSAVNGALSALGQLGKLADPFHDVSLSLKNLPAIFDGTFQTITQNFPLVTALLSALWSDMINEMRVHLANLGNETVSVFVSTNLAGLVKYAATGKVFHPDPFSTNYPTNTAAPYVRKLHNINDSNVQLAATDAANSDSGNPLGLPVAQLQQGGLRQPSDAATPKVNKLMEATKAFEAFLRTVSPYAKDMEEMEAANVAFNKASVAGVAVNKILAEAGLTRDEINKRLARSVVGAGNAETDYADKVRLLDEALKKANITLEERNRLALASRIKLLESQPSSLSAGVELAGAKSEQSLSNVNAIGEKSVSSALSFQNAPAVAATEVEALNEAMQNGTIKAPAYANALMGVLKSQRDLASGEVLAKLEAQDVLLDKAKLGSEALAGIYAKTDMGEKFAIQIQAINDAVAAQPSLMKQATLAIRDMQIEMAKAGTDAASGFTAGLLEAQKSAADVAHNVTKTMTDLANDITTGFVDALENKRIDIRKMLASMGNEFLTDLVKQNITAPIMGLLGPNGPGGGAFAQGLGLIFGGSGGSTGPLGSSSANAMWVQMSSGPLSALGFGSGSSVSPELRGALDVGGGSGAPGGASGSLGGLLSLGSATSGGYGSAGSGASAGGGGGIGGLLGGSGGILDKLGGSGGVFSSNGFLANLFSGVGGGQGTLSNSILNLFGMGQSGTGVGELAAAADGGAAAGGDLSSIFGAGTMSMFSGAGMFGSSGSIADLFSMIPGFASGGEFQVGGVGGTDSQLVQFKATPDETVSIRRPGESNPTEIGGKQEMHLHLHGVTDADSFKRSHTQVQSGMIQLAARAARRNGTRG